MNSFNIKKEVLFLLTSLLTAFFFIILYQLYSVSFSLGDMITLILETPVSFIKILLIFMFGIYMFITLIRRLHAIKQHNQNWKTSITIYALLTVFALGIVVLLISSQQFFGLKATWNWILTHPRPFLLNFIIVESLILFVISVTKKYYYAGVISFFIFSSLSLTNYFKMKFLDEPLYPTDFSQFRQLKEVAPMVLGGYLVYIVVAILFLLIIIHLLKQWMPPYKLTRLHRIILFFITSLIIWSYVNHQNPIMKKVFSFSNVTYTFWDPRANYNVNGTVLGFLLVMNQDIFDEPKNYTKEKVIAAAKNMRKEMQLQSFGLQKTGKKKPNVLYIMSEAFWDPTMMPNVTFNKDPIPFIRNEMNHNIRGKALVPEFGGGTSNMEFEALTGFNMTFLRGGTFPYMQAVGAQNSIPTIATILKGRGYKTVALHPFQKYFYKRDIVYPKFGFEEFIGMKDMHHTELRGSYVNDMSASKEIIELLKKNGEPTFIHTVTMQNHLPFSPGSYKGEELRISGLEKDKRLILGAYAEGIYDSDKAFQYLMEQLQTLNEPTLVVFWGDHLPYLGDGQQLYKEAGFIKEGTSSEEKRKLHETPLFITANYLVQEKDLGTISLSYINSLVFELIGEELPPYYAFLAKVQKEIPAMTHDVSINSSGKILEKKNKKQRRLLEEYRLLQYDLLSGKQYAKDILFP